MRSNLFICLFVFVCLFIFSALHLSAAAGHEDCVTHLLRACRADAALTDLNGQTAADLALKPEVRRAFMSTDNPS